MLIERICIYGELILQPFRNTVAFCFLERNVFRTESSEEEMKMNGGISSKESEDEEEQKG